MRQIREEDHAVVMVDDGQEFRPSRCFLHVQSPENGYPKMLKHILKLSAVKLFILLSLHRPSSGSI
jgi:hypothetical protein